MPRMSLNCWFKQYKCVTSVTCVTGEKKGVMAINGKILNVYMDINSIICVTGNKKWLF